MTTITAITPAAVTDDDIVVLPEGIAANARELDDIRTALKVLEKREVVLKTAVRSFLEGAGLAAVTDGSVSVFRTEHDRTGVSRERLEALYPSVLKDVRTTTPVVQIRVEVR